MAELRRLGIKPIVGLVHHGGGPAYSSLIDLGFAAGLADHARAVAERYPWVDDWTPVNEPLTTARFSCRYGLWYPHSSEEGQFWLALLNEIDATRLSMRAIRAVNPRARLIQTEDLGSASGTPQTSGQTAFENERRWITWDLLAGLVTPGHALWNRIAQHGFADRLAAIADDPCPPDVIGINHYLCSTRYLTHEFARHPGIGPAGDGSNCINIEAVRTVEQLDGIDGLIKESWERYRQSIAITECHNGSARDEQMRWFYQVWRAAEAARADGVDVIAVTAWSLLGAYDWNSLLTNITGHYEAGVFDVRSAPPRPTAMTGLLRALVRGEPPPLLHIIDGKGWWQRNDRLLPSYRTAGNDAPHRPTGPPLLITGKTGTLAQAIERACKIRGLAYVLTDRSALSLENASSIEAAVQRYRPWAIINCAGMVNLDAAEVDQQTCQRANALGPARLAAACAGHGIRFVQISSDQVFDGRSGPYSESAPVAPLNAYGRAKADAEQHVAVACPDALIIRTAAFFSPFDRYNFAVQTIDRLLAGAIVEAANDQYISPTYVPDLVDTMLDLLIDGEKGVWHLASAGGASWAEFAGLLAEARGLNQRHIRGIASATLKQAAERPADARLQSERGQLMPSLGSAIARFTELYMPALPHAVAAE